MAVLNRKIDEQINTSLNTGTVTDGSSTTIPSIDLFQSASVKLQNASVPWDSNICLLYQPSFLSYLDQEPHFASADSVSLWTYACHGPGWRC